MGSRAWGMRFYTGLVQFDKRARPDNLHTDGVSSRICLVFVDYPPSVE